MNDVSAIILAAGRGVRMEGKTPKVLLKLSGKPIIFWAIEALMKIGIEDVNVIINDKSKRIKFIVNKEFPKVQFVEHQGILGTGGSTKAALDVLKLKTTVLVLFGDDSGLYKKETIRRFVEFHKNEDNIGTFLTCVMDKPTDIGGLKIDEKGNVVGVMTRSEMERLNIRQHQVACGAFCFDRGWLKKNIGKVAISKISGELPLPGIIYVGAGRGEYMRTYLMDDVNQWNSVNTRKELEEARKKKRLLI